MKTKLQTYINLLEIQEQRQTQALIPLNQQKLQLESGYEQSKLKVSKASLLPQRLIPEQEILRFQFLQSELRCQKQTLADQEHIEKKIQGLLQAQKSIKLKIAALNEHKKTLEKYAKHLSLIQGEKNLDTWALQKRSNDEN